MTSALLLFSALLGCQADEALASAALVADDVATGDLAPASGALIRPFLGVSEATQSLRALQGHLEGLPRQQRARAQAAGLTLVTSCPFNRGAAQVPLVMAQVLARHADPALEPMKAGVAAHVAVLEQLDLAALPAPVFGDYLYMASVGVLTADDLAASPDPVALSLILMEDLPGLVQGYDGATLDKIHQAGAILGAATQDRWPLRAELEGFSLELDRLMAEESLSPAAFSDVEALSGLLDTYVGHRC